MYKKMVTAFTEEALRKFFHTPVEIKDIRMMKDFAEFDVNVSTNYYGVLKLHGFVSSSATVYIWDEDKEEYVMVL